MRAIFNTISLIQPRTVVVPTLLIVGAAASLAGGQVALASVFAAATVGHAVSSFGSAATFNRGQKRVCSLHGRLLKEGKFSLSDSWLGKVLRRSEEEPFENRKVMNEHGELVDRTNDTEVTLHITDERFLRPIQYSKKNS